MITSRSGQDAQGALPVPFPAAGSRVGVPLKTAVRGCRAPLRARLRQGLEPLSGVLKVVQEIALVQRLTLGTLAWTVAAATAAHWRES